MDKIKLKRVKYLGDKPNAPDYTGFVKGKDGYYKIIGYINNITSDLDLSFKKIDIDNLNKWDSIEFNQWVVEKKTKL